jgi:hypothetical protein
VETLIKGYLLELRRNWRKSQLNWPGGLAYHWNEREFHWDLFQRMREYAGVHGLGSGNWVRAEPALPTPRWASGAGAPRADIVVVDHSAYKRYLRRLAEGGSDDDFPTFESMIELKVVWTGAGRASNREGFKYDITKLQRALRDSITRSAYFVILDNLDRNHVPYFDPDELRRLKRGTRVVVFHWPDGSDPVEDLAESRIGRY